jgi:site-specific DNA recombinase
MQVALYARVSTVTQSQDETITSQVQTLKRYIHQQGWSLLPAHEFLDDGVSGARLDRPALDRLRDCAQRGEVDAVVVLSPDRLARNYAHQWLLVEEFAKWQTRWIFLQNPFGDTPQGKLLTQLQGMMAEYERTQILDRTRRGRLEKARRGEYLPWAYRCYGYRYLPKRHGCPPQVVIDPTQAAVIQQMYRALIEEQLSSRQITKRLNTAQIPPPGGKSPVWQPATVTRILTNPVYAGQARYNYRQPSPSLVPQPGARVQPAAKTRRGYRPASEWIWSEAPAIIAPEWFEKAQTQLRQNAQTSCRRYQPISHRYLLRTLVRCGDCGLTHASQRQRSGGGRYEYLYYACSGHNPLTRGRPAPCPSRRVRADRLDTVVWQSLCTILRTPTAIPQLHALWGHAQDQNLETLTTHSAHLLQRQQRIERQLQRLLDAYQAEAITLSELKVRQEKLRAEEAHLKAEIEQLTHTRERTIQWQQVHANAEHFCRLLGENLERLTFEDRQAVTRCLIRKVVVTGEQVDIYYAFPFEFPPQVWQGTPHQPEGAAGQFYCLRLSHRDRQRSTQEHLPDRALAPPQRL